jgi:hypothetical protein
MDRSRSTVYRMSARLGLEWDRSQTQAAVAAKAVDTQAARKALEATLLGEAATTLTQLHQPVRYFGWGGKTRQPVEHTSPEPLPADKLRLMQTAGLAIDRALKLADHQRLTAASENHPVVIFTGEDQLQ